MNKSHLFLRNKTGSSRIFNKSRGRDDSEDLSADEKNYSRQRERLRNSSRTFINDRAARHSIRDNSLELPHFDLISIDFLKIADFSVIHNFEGVYGLSATYYSNLNQTVLFAINDYQRFEENFLSEIKRFSEEREKDTTQFRPLTLISDFKYWSRDSMNSLSLPENLTDLLFELIDRTPQIIKENKYDIQKEALKSYLAKNNIKIAPLDDYIFQIDEIGKEELDYILNNFDIIQRVQALNTVRVRPDSFGETVKETDAAITLKDGAPTIGVIDTGVLKMPVLEPILEEEGIDLTDPDHPQPYRIDLVSDSSHGTTVATLASFGNTFYRDMQATEIEADAKIFSIKLQRGETGIVNLAGIKESIIKANKDYGIRIFNLSMTARCKNYNSTISTYAFELDRLAYELDILIFISVGNLDVDDIRYILEVAGSEEVNERIKRFLTYPNHFYNPHIDMEEAKCHDCEAMNLCEPSESMNNMSVGAVAENFRNNPDCHGLSYGGKYPAYYTRKYYMDYNRDINGTRFKINQKNRNLFKPDIVMPGGDQLSCDSRLPVLAPRPEGTFLCIIENSGTSYATPLAANIAAKIVSRYPTLNMQTVKALMINSAEPVDHRFLDNTLDNLKIEENNAYPNVSANEKRTLSNKYDAERLSKYISGHGIPDIAKCIDSGGNVCTFVVEDEILYESHQVINLNLPDYLCRATKRNPILKLTATLCYKFNPIRTNVLNYCPVHISFNFGRSMNPNDPTANAAEYASTNATENERRRALKAHAESWSDDFYPASNKIFSNVQKKSMNLTRDEINGTDNQISIIFRCTGRNEALRNERLKFSFVLRVEQKDNIGLDEYNLYDSLEQINRVQAAAEAHITDLKAEADA